MNFEDERYVRVYTRKTVTTKLLGWEGRACLHALLLEVDRAGVLELEGMDPADALSALSDIPVEFARVGMARILERGVAVVSDGRLFLPRFLEAQEARQSDAQRQRESRARRAAELRVSQGAVRAMATAVTNRDHMESQNVTECHTESHDVTSGHSVLSRAQLSSEIPPVVPRGDAAAAPPPEPPRARKKREGLWRRVPATWQVTDEHRQMARDLALDVEREAEKFRDHEFSKPRSDPNATFRNWLRTSAERGGARPGPRRDDPPPGFIEHSQRPESRWLGGTPKRRAGQPTLAFGGSK